MKKVAKTVHLSPNERIEYFDYKKRIIECKLATVGNSKNPTLSPLTKVVLRVVVCESFVLFLSIPFLTF